MNVEQVVGQVLSVAVAAAFLALGLRGLIARRPLLFAGRWLVFIFGLIFSKQLTPLLGDEASRLRFSQAVSPAEALVAGALLVVLWFQLQGYVVFGATEPILRNALRCTLDERGLPHEDRPGAIHLPSEGLDLQLQFNELGGTAHIKVAPARGRPLLRGLVRDLRRYFASHPVAHGERVFTIYTCIGALFVAVAMFYLL